MNPTQHTSVRGTETQIFSVTGLPPAPYHLSLYLITSETYLLNPIYQRDQTRWAA